MIYGYCLVPIPEHKPGLGVLYKWTKTPVLLASLRGELELYHEALHYYYKHNIIKFGSCKPTSFAFDLGLPSRGSICHLDITPPYVAYILSLLCTDNTEF